MFVNATKSNTDTLISTYVLINIINLLLCFDLKNPEVNDVAQVILVRTRDCGLYYKKYVLSALQFYINAFNYYCI